MYKVKNGKIIRKIAIRAFKYNKTRNIIGLLAICLTAILFTSVFSIGISALNSVQQTTMRQVGTQAHGGFKYLTMPQYEKLKSDSKIKDISYNIIVGTAENPELSKLYTEIRYTEEKSAKWSFSMPETGRLPEKENEIATTVQVLDTLGIEHKLGESVPLEFTANGIKHKDNFILCGFRSVDDVTVANQAFVSYEYANKTAPVWQNVPERFGERSYESGSVNPSLWFSNSFDIEQKMEELKERCGFGEDISSGVNWAYAGSEVDITTIFLILGILLLIMLSAYLIIYNIFYISVSRDIRFYGLLKTIGTTNRQLKKIVRKQAEILCLAGIPAGLILGFLLSYVLVPVVMRTTAIHNYGVQINPIVFIGGALFTFITVMVSCIRPCRYASRVSPIDAVRYTESNTGKRIKKKTGKITPLGMAFDNIKRTPKKALSVILSISLSVILLNAAVTISRGFDMDKYIQNMVVSDFYITDKTVTSPIGGERKLDSITPEIINDVKNFAGISEIGCTYMRQQMHSLSDMAYENTKKICEEYKENLPEKYVGQQIRDVYEKHEIISSIYGVDGIAGDKLEIYEGELDMKRFKSGNYIIVSSFADDGGGHYYDIGDKVTIDFGNGKSKEYEVMAIGNITYALSPQFSYLLGVDFIVYSDEFISQTGEVNALNIAFNAKDGEYDRVEEQVKNYCENINSGLDFKSRSTYTDSFHDAQNMYLIIGGVLSFILGLIGLLNFINSMITSISARQHEFAVLQSIGMTGGQLEKMLICEGGLYAAVSVGFTLTAGNLISYALIMAIANQMWFFTYHFTVIPLIYSVAVLAAASLAIPIVCYNKMCKASIVNRLRVSE